MVCLHTDTMGVHPACILFDGQGYSPPRPGIPPETTPPILHILPLIAHQLASARPFSLHDHLTSQPHPVASHGLSWVPIPAWPNYYNHWTARWRRPCRLAKPEVEGGRDFQRSANSDDRGTQPDARPLSTRGSGASDGTSHRLPRAHL